MPTDDIGIIQTICTTGRRSNYTRRFFSRKNI
jgi:hypothetical protein